MDDLLEQRKPQMKSGNAWPQQGSVGGSTFRAGGFAEGAQPLNGEGVGREGADVVQDCQLHAAPASCQRLFKRGRHISGTPRQPV